MKRDKKLNKVPTIFNRDFEGNPSLVTSEPNPACDWVFNGEGVATRKYDGTCCYFDGERWLKRREVKANKKPPDDFIQVNYDENTRKRMGWVPVSSGDKWHLEGIDNIGGNAETGTYELCGPKVQGNPEGLEGHQMIKHSDAQTFYVGRSVEDIKDWLSKYPFEGIVFHHPDGRMAKIKRRDFGIKCPLTPLHKGKENG